MLKFRVFAVIPVVLAFLFSLSLPLSAAEITVWTNWGPATPHGQILASIVEEFNREHPDVNVTLDVMSGNFEEKVVLAYTSGVAPDIIIGGVARYALEFGGDDGMFLALDRFIDGPHGFSRDEFVSDMWVNSIVDGKTYQLALDGNERALFINADLALAAGLDVSQPVPVQDWDELLSWARKLTRRNGDETVQWGFNANQQNNGDRLHWMWLNGGAVWTDDYSESVINHPRNVEAMRFAAQMIQEYEVAPAPGAYSGSAVANFQNGRFAMFIGASTNIESTQRAGIQLVTVPGPPGWGENPGRFAGATASTIQIMSTTRYPEAAWQLVRRIAYERAPEITDVRGIPYMIESLKVDKFQSQPWQAFATSIMTYEGRNQLVKGFDGDAFWGVVESTWLSVMRGEIDAQVALDQAAGPIGAMRAEWRNR